MTDGGWLHHSGPVTIGFDAGNGDDWTAVATVMDGAVARVTRVLAPQLEALAAAFTEYRLAAEAVTPAFRAFARALAVMRWRARLADYEAHGRTRPDGRPRRSGHRHRGTPAWQRRHG